MAAMTMVLGYVPTPPGRAALEAAIAEARLRGESLHVINSSRGDSYVDSSFAGEDDLAELRTRLEAGGIPFEIEQRLGEDGAEAVISVAQEQGAQLVVIGLRRRTATGKLIFGSDAQRILLGVDCPVLAVKAG